MVDVGIIGASGGIGQAILKESLVHARSLTLDDLNKSGVVINAFSSTPSRESNHIQTERKLINTLKAKNTRFIIGAGKRTGKYKTSDDNLVMDSKNESYIFYAGYVIAVFDETEYPKYLVVSV
ncbi:hypothetical protein INT46_009268 [Mucor plumbeus]|uniref:Uncharacterized protein n=1 Tax=Mucor plumbeus TaxID=97098 RepID=A0A8H7QIF6_9FUNG|nr:hypothetical protein INT46_009268 [Mucor plumbeus]